MSEADGYILRISSDELVNQVFDSTVYYTNMQRKWKQSQITLFLHRTKIGDAFVGYGVIRKASRRELLAKEDRKACEAGDWKTALEFLYVKRFDHPILIKDTFLNKSKLRGRYLHGLHIEKSFPGTSLLNSFFRKLSQFTIGNSEGKLFPGDIGCSQRT